MVNWQVADDLDVLLGQLNALFPNRSKASDGSIGDAAHASRDSDHNPWFVFQGIPYVTARDFTHDPDGNGVDCQKLADALVAANDPRIKYIIWNRRIWTPGVGWKTYKGSNPHTKHLHLSVDAGANVLDGRAWTLRGFTTPVINRPPSTTPPGRRILSRGMTGEDVWQYQDFMNKKFPLYSKLPRTNPPTYGPMTIEVTKEFQRRSRLAPDGVVGPQVYAELARYGFR